MSTKDYVGLGKIEVRLERLIEKQTRLIREARATHPFRGRKKAQLRKRIAKVAEERMSFKHKFEVGNKSKQKMHSYEEIDETVQILD